MSNIHCRRNIEKMLKILIFLVAPPPRAMIHGNKMWAKMMHKYYSTHMKTNKCIRQFHLFQTMTNMKKCHPHPWANDPTITNFDGWLDHNFPKVNKVQ
jgi:hypothetical protein